MFCGKAPGTADHCPSKVLLDKPYPLNLPTVTACAKCNRSFSLDEEFVACLIECVSCCSVDPECLSRKSIGKILTRSPKLAAKIQALLAHAVDGPRLWEESLERVKRVVLKLARGHLDYELSI